MKAKLLLLAAHGDFGLLLETLAAANDQYDPEFYQHLANYANYYNAPLNALLLQQKADGHSADLPDWAQCYGVQQYLRHRDAATIVTLLSDRKGKAKETDSTWLAPRQNKACKKDCWHYQKSLAVLNDQTRNAFFAYCVQGKAAIDETPITIIETITNGGDPAECLYAAGEYLSLCADPNAAIDDLRDALFDTEDWLEDTAQLYAYLKLVAPVLKPQQWFAPLHRLTQDVLAEYLSDWTELEEDDPNLENIIQLLRYHSDILDKVALQLLQKQETAEVLKQRMRPQRRSRIDNDQQPIIKLSLCDPFETNNNQ